MDREQINAYLTAALAEITAESARGSGRYMGIPDPLKGRGPELGAKFTTRLLPIPGSALRGGAQRKGFLPGRLSEREKRAAEMWGAA